VKRRPEPELMETVEQAQAYAETDFNESNERFLRLLTEHYPNERGGARALDLGCGPADIVLRFLRRFPQATCDALDGSRSMLDLARAALEREPNLARRARLICDKLPSPRLETHAYDLILSNSLLHHLHEPQALWRSLPTLGRSGAFVLVMDLMRPSSTGAASEIVERYAKDASSVLREDFYNSLLAAFEPLEVSQQLRAAGLETVLSVQAVSDRHLAVWGRLP
jgi:SAM-dependent methyltransferase